MGGSKAKAVGGTPTSPIAKGYQNMLGQSLQQGSDFQNTLHSLLSGSNQTGFMQNISQMQPQSVNLNQNVAQSAPGQIGIQDPSINNMGLMGMGQQAQMQDTSGLAGILAQLSGAIPMANFQANQNVPQVQSMSPDVNGTFANALTQQLQTQQQNDINGLHQSFVNSGGSGEGTPGAYAEAVYRAQAAPNIAAALGNLNLQQNAQNLTAQQANQNAALQNMGLNLQGLLGSTSINQQGMAQGANNINSAAGIIGNQNQLGLQNQTQNRQLDVSQLQNFLSNFNQTNAQNQQAGLTQRAQDIGVNSGNQNALMQMLGMNLNQAQGLNNFALNQGQLGLQSQQLQQQGMLQALSQLFGGLNQTNQMGTTQAQTVQQPSGFQNFMSGVSGVAGAAAGIAPLFL